MPNRIIRDLARTSSTLDMLSHGAERFFWHLVLTADDFGRFEADPALLLASCFPRRVGRIRTKQILAWRNELVTTQLIQLYERDGRFYGYFPNWEKFQRVRSRHSRYPAPPDKGHTFTTVTADDGNSPPIAADGGNSPQSASESRDSRFESREIDGKQSNNEILGACNKKNTTEKFPRKGKFDRNVQLKETTGIGKLACVLEK